MLIDTFAWVHFFNHLTSKFALIIDNLLASEQTIHTCPTIYQEVLQGIGRDKEFNRVKGNFLTYDFLLFSDQVAASEQAATIYRQCWKKGVAIRKANDCLIAYYSLYHQVSLLHDDSDFTQISKIHSLQIVSV